MLNSCPQRGSTIVFDSWAQLCNFIPLHGLQLFSKNCISLWIYCDFLHLFSQNLFKLCCYNELYSLLELFYMKFHSWEEVFILFSSLVGQKDFMFIQAGPTCLLITYLRGASSVTLHLLCYSGCFPTSSRHLENPLTKQLNTACNKSDLWLPSVSGEKGKGYLFIIFRNCYVCTGIYMLKIECCQFVYFPRWLCMRSRMKPRPAAEQLLQVFAKTAGESQPTALSDVFCALVTSVPKSFIKAWAWQLVLFEEYEYNMALVKLF